MATGRKISAQDNKRIRSKGVAKQDLQTNHCKLQVKH